MIISISLIYTPIYLSNMLEYGVIKSDEKSRCLVLFEES